MGAGSKFFIGAYGAAWTGLGPFIGRFTRLRDGYDQRLVPNGWPFAEPETANSGQKPELAASGSTRIWIQAASGGESLLVHSLLPAITVALREQGFNGPLQFLCTSCTRQGMEVLLKFPQEKLTDPSVTVLPRYFPLDRPAIMQRAVGAFAPDLIILLETELWPGLLSSACKVGVPVCVLNGRMRQKSLESYSRLSFFWREHAPRNILAISDADADRFSRLFGPASTVTSMPNIKFDMAAENLQPDAGRAFLGIAMQGEQLRDAIRLPEQSLLAVFASVREEEEDLLLPTLHAFGGLSVQGRPVAVAIAPRHMHRVESWRRKLGAAGFPVVLRSMNVSPDSDPISGSRLPIFLWDSFGELQKLYAAADAAFVGGSLAPLGGQNFLEAASQGLVPVTGPHMENFLWVGDDFFTGGIGACIETADKLTGSLTESLNERFQAINEHMARGLGWKEARMEAARDQRSRFAQWLSPRTGGSRQAGEAVAKLLAERLALSGVSG